MKKEITTVFLTLATAFGFAQNAIPAQGSSKDASSFGAGDPIPNLIQLEVKPALPSIEEKVNLRKSFGYIRMGVSESELPKDSLQMLPGLGLGYRLASGPSAIDISASFNRRDFRTDEGKQHTFVYTLPKANYLYYVSPDRNNSFYAGGGLAWGGVRTKDEREFHGLIPNLALGYEMGRNAAWRSFAQLDVSQPAIAASQKGDLPKAYAELSLGAGF